ncbi:UNVERIFIED_ORG: multidrug efflux pump subunit AcrA (membrane-fusion protein) [Methylobacterium sp. SuP10 SLI 274]|nr:multidrug efflux pump subunit AcrA (membrane-fusion protein) [Methylorubrum extorquens]MDF9789583.1 multidrug efflux pump subunit AcrA (membrane-fusion protein) [Methylorubrum extorquens]MDF9861301.1 multidrug efflux pump subunit AcrA (membrane-fusion protein) [Methylorubrum pseudosasae]MDH6634928.1 multidrug efflux pump subunit AcrA (membrane-fusion protein) [Methylobacterium sp. SuP10 SLI 274]MDH6664098.1 multidrug efflux pump subunit AcrA (membrane-fusion protein) [Methylorubrum zatmanii]
MIAPGQLVVEPDIKKVQHPTGGRALRVREGARVQAGDVLIRLDETQTRASLDIILNALDELSAHRARDEAERAGAATFPPVAHLTEGETRLFTARKVSFVTGKLRASREHRRDLVIHRRFRSTGERLYPCVRDVDCDKSRRSTKQSPPSSFL